jgi:Asp-tRNA(Asn)/Glu-tRNA(Gln) amidotransferase C subunit
VVLLSYAVYCGHENIFNLLLNSGADPALFTLIDNANLNITHPKRGNERVIQRLVGHFESFCIYVYNTISLQMSQISTLTTANVNSSNVSRQDTVDSNTLKQNTSDNHTSKSEVEYIFIYKLCNYGSLYIRKEIHL